MTEVIGFGHPKWILDPALLPYAGMRWMEKPM